MTRGGVGGNGCMCEDDVLQRRGRPVCVGVVMVGGLWLLCLLSVFLHRPPQQFCQGDACAVVCCVDGWTPPLQGRVRVVYKVLSMFVCLPLCAHTCGGGGGGGGQDRGC